MKTQVVALGERDNGSLNFGFNELSRDFRDTGFIRLKNFGNAPASFTVSDAADGGSPHSTAFPSSVTVFGHGGEALLPVRLTVPAASAGGAAVPCAGVVCDSTPLSNVSGQITLTPVGGGNNGVTLRVPYYIVPAVSDVDVHAVNANQFRRTGSANVLATNSRFAPAEGTADWYDWGIKDKRDHGLRSNDLQAVGVQSFPDSPVHGVRDLDQSPLVERNDGRVRHPRRRQRRRESRLRHRRRRLRRAHERQLRRRGRRDGQ